MNKITTSPDFEGLSVDDAVRDFENRIQKYEDAYEVNVDIKYCV